MPSPNNIIFNKPFPPTGLSWNELTEAERTLWTLWALGQPIADTDFRSILRNGNNAFAIVNTNHNTDIGGTAVLELPPAPPSFEDAVVFPTSVEVTVSPNFFFYVRVTPKDDVHFQLWATPPYDWNGRAPLELLTYVGKFVVTPNANPADETDSMVAAYQANVADLETNGNKAIALFLWLYSNGQMRFAGSTKTQILIV